MTHAARLLILGVLLSACASAETATSGSTPRDLRSLRWLEGKWRGTEPNGKAFYEGYRMLNDSTIRTYNYADSAAVTPSDSGAINLRAGRITTGSGATLWAVSQLSDGFVRFDPVQGARNSFTWRRDSE